MPEGLARVLRRPVLIPEVLVGSDARPYLYQAALVRQKPAETTRWQIVQLYDLRPDILRFNLYTLLRLVVALLVLLAEKLYEPATVTISHFTVPVQLVAPKQPPRIS